MSKKVIAVSTLIIIGGILVFGLNNKTQSNLVNPQILTPSEPPTPPQVPKTFQFDSTTDLKLELEKVNPQVLDSDFE